MSYVYSILNSTEITAQKMKFFIKDFLSKCDQIWSFLRIWSHLLKKSLMENFVFCAVNKRLEVLFLKLDLIAKLHFFGESNDDLEMSETTVKRWNFEAWMINEIILYYCYENLNNQYMVLMLLIYLFMWYIFLIRISHKSKEKLLHYWHRNYFTGW